MERLNKRGEETPKLPEKTKVQRKTKDKEDEGKIGKAETGGNGVKSQGDKGNNKKLAIVEFKELEKEEWEVAFVE